MTEEQSLAVAPGQNASPGVHPTSGSALPLCVDLDGTLLRTDMLYESVLVLLKRAPWLVFLLPIWLMAGKANLKRRIAERVTFDPAALPYHPEFLDYLRLEHARGRPLILATATDERLAEPISEHLGLFGAVFASDGITNLSGAAKAARLVEAFGERGFTYAGNGRADLEVWRHAGEAIAVDAPASVSKGAGRLTTIDREFSSARAGFRTIVKALRPHQWVKNALVFLPVLTAHKVGSLDLLGSSALAFVAFSLCASSVYVLNDLLDLEADRHHPRKRLRPFASGALPVLWGLAMVPVLLGLGMLLGSVVGVEFLAILGLYFFLTLGYSVHLKQVALADVIVLAGLYTIRIFAGATAAGVPVSDWLLAFSMFLFLSLALVKRTSELDMLRERNQSSTKGRGYLVGDRDIIASLGAASGYLAVLVLALYATSSDVAELYSHSRRLWFLCPLLLYWMSRVWLLAQRGQMHDDPVVFALKDVTSYVVGACVVAVVLSAL